MPLLEDIRAKRPGLRRYAAVRRATQSPLVRPALRARELWRHRLAASGKPSIAFEYLLHGKEVTNFTYPLANMLELKEFVSSMTGASVDSVGALVDEVATDESLLSDLRSKLRPRIDREDEPYFGRRLIWYCLARLERPEIVVETGTHDGLGTVLLIEALRRNTEEGAAGVLHSFDIDPAAGWLARDRAGSLARFHLGDIRETLPIQLGRSTIDFFIHDSLHTYEQEKFEFEFALSRGAERLVLLTDNAKTGESDDFAESTWALRDICAGLGAPYSVFRERPLNHFVGGGSAGVGIVSERAPST